jgi:hypothetical protein
MLCRVSALCAGSVPGLPKDPAQKRSRSEPRFSSLCQVFQVNPDCGNGEKKQ